MITNAHVCDNYSVVQVGKEIGFVVKKDEKADLCLVQVNRSRVGLKIAQSVEAGQEVTAVSHRVNLLQANKAILINPDRTQYYKIKLHRECPADSRKIDIDSELREIIREYTKLGMPHHKIMAIIDRSLAALNGANICEIKQQFAELNMEVLPGMSGSPVLNSSGHVVGVIFARKRESPSTHSVLVRLSDLQKFVKDIK